MKRVLVVDDSSTVRQQVRDALTPAGYEVVEAVDGLDGLEKLRSTPDVGVVLCDINMPRMTGIEMVLESLAAGFTVPILMLTSEGQPSLIRRARDVGVKGWVVKPFKPDLLVMAVKKVMGAGGLV